MEVWFRSISSPDAVIVDATEDGSSILGYGTSKVNQVSDAKHYPE